MSSASGVKVFCLRPVELYDVVPFLIQSQNYALFLQFFSTKKTGGKYIGEREMEVKESDISHDIRKQNFFFHLCLFPGQLSDKLTQ
jgi:hypothetical protein